ncbi:MAG: hypothetical protein EPGJADBJ_02296 [Saprospiraceae bacterium]|nr:hypothetical protein [Saprospiraceae bacterium]
MNACFEKCFYGLRIFVHRDATRLAQTTSHICNILFVNFLEYYFCEIMSEPEQGCSHSDIHIRTGSGLLPNQFSRHSPAVHSTTDEIGPRLRFQAVRYEPIP